MRTERLTQRPEEYYQQHEQPEQWRREATSDPRQPIPDSDATAAHHRALTGIRRLMRRLARRDTLSVGAQPAIP